MALSCLKLDENGLRSLANVEKLERLQVLFASGNRLAEFWEMDRLNELPNLMEVAFFNNPMTRKPQYRQSIIKKLPGILILDEREITADERQRVDANQPYEAGKVPPLVHYQQFP
jgi:hypothetical protein